MSDHAIMNPYRTTLETDIRFIRSGYPVGTVVEVLTPLLYDGVSLCRFPGGEETWLSSSRLTEPPERKS